MTLDPGQFHAALIHRQTYPGVATAIDVYAPPGFDLDEHLRRLDQLIHAADPPLPWQVNLHAGDDYLERMLAERPGNVVVIAGRNDRKMEYISRCVEAGLNVLADKPWIIQRADLSRLTEALERAEETGVVVSDVMTERHEITNAVQRALVTDSDLFGDLVAGGADAPAVELRSVHHILKTVAGKPLRRPLWWFSPEVQGNALADVGTHLVDLVLWTLFPDEEVQPGDIGEGEVRHWATWIDLDRFARVTGGAEPPAALHGRLKDGALACDANSELRFTTRGTHVRVTALWEVEAEHGDTHFARYRGSRSTVEVRQGPAEGWRPEVYLLPARGSADLPHEALRRWLLRHRDRWPGLDVRPAADGALRIAMPDALRLGHERHFAEVTREFLDALRGGGAPDRQELARLRIKYALTTS